MGFDDVYEAANGLLGGHALLDALLAHEEVDLARRAAHVAEVGVGQLAQAVDDAAHDGYLHAAQVARSLLDALCGLLEVEEGAPAGGTSHELSLDDAGTGGLQDVVGEGYTLVGCAIPCDFDAVPDAVAQGTEPFFIMGAIAGG